MTLYTYIYLVRLAHRETKKIDGDDEFSVPGGLHRFRKFMISKLLKIIIFETNIKLYGWREISKLSDFDKIKNNFDISKIFLKQCFLTIAQKPKNRVNSSELDV